VWWEFEETAQDVSDKNNKIPSRRGPDALRYILNDFEANANGNHFRLLYYTRRKVFLRILKTIGRTQQIWSMLILLIGEMLITT
jgi:hypothetical protein